MGPLVIYSLWSSRLCARVIDATERGDAGEFGGAVERSAASREGSYTRKRRSRRAEALWAKALELASWVVAGSGSTNGAGDGAEGGDGACERSSN